MSTETTFYRVRRTTPSGIDDGCHYEWLDTVTSPPSWSHAVLRGCVWRNKSDAALFATKYGGKVITVRHKLIPAKPRTHDRAWALRQLAKGRRVRHTSWNSPMYLATCEERGISLCNCRSESRVVAGVALSPADGYTLWQEPAK